MAGVLVPAGVIASGVGVGIGVGLAGPNCFLFRCGGWPHNVHADSLSDTERLISPVIRITGSSLRTRNVKDSEADLGVVAFNADGYYVSEGYGYEDAGHMDVHVHHRHNKLEDPNPASLQIYPRNPLCISFIGQNGTNGDTKLWPGELGKVCNKQWYYSDPGQVVARLPLYCTWIDDVAQLTMIVRMYWSKSWPVQDG